MAELGNEWPTLIDLQSRLDQNGNVAAIMEMLARQNPIITDAIYMQANNGTKHRALVRTGIPEPVYRRFNRGVPNVKTTTTPLEYATAMLEAYSEVDKEMVDISGNAAAFRASESRGIIQGFNNRVSRAIFYDNEKVTAEGVTGLTPVYSDVSAKTATQIVDGGGRGSNNTSVWFITWGEASTHMIYPAGMPMGLDHKDLGEVTAFDPEGAKFQAYRDWYRWHIGLGFKDWEGNARIANIDMTALTKDAATGADLIDLMIEASTRLNTGLVNEGKTIIYANRRVISYLKRQAMNAKNVNLSYEQVLGWDGMTRKELYFDGFPVRQTDELLTTEAALLGIPA